MANARTYWLLLASALVALDPPQAGAELRTPPKDLALAAVSGAVSVEPGGTTTVTLQLLDERKKGVFGGKKEFDFSIVQQPLAGRIESLQQMSRTERVDEAMAVYSVDPHTTAVEDQFEFEARERGSHATVTGTMHITILRPKLELRPEVLVDFGEVYSGTRGRATVRATNRGNALLSARVSVEGPFELLGQGLLALAPGESKEIPVLAVPLGEGIAEGTLWFGGSVQASLKLVAASARPYYVSPGKLVFDRAISGQRQDKMVEIQNRTKSTLKVTAKASPPFAVRQETLMVMPSSVSAIPVSCVPPQTGEIRGQLELEAAGIRSPVELLAVVRERPPGPAKLEVAGAPFLEFGSCRIGGVESVRGMEIRNSGETAWSGAVRVEGSFVVARRELEIAPGAAVWLEVVCRPVQAGTCDGAVLLGDALKISLSADAHPAHEVLKPEVSKPVPSRVVESPQAVPKHEQEKLVVESFPPNDTGQLRLPFFRVEPDHRRQTAAVRWRPVELHDPSRFHLMTRKTRPASTGTALLEEYWEEVPDVVCTKRSDGLYEFAVDRLRPDWGYTFAISLRGTDGLEQARSERFQAGVISVREEDGWEAWLYGMAAVAALGLGGYVFWNFNRWFGPSL